MSYKNCLYLVLWSLTSNAKWETTIHRLIQWAQPKIFLNAKFKTYFYLNGIAVILDPPVQDLNRKHNLQGNVPR